MFDGESLLFTVRTLDIPRSNGLHNGARAVQEHFQAIVSFSSKTPSSGVLHLLDGKQEARYEDFRA